MAKERQANSAAAEAQSKKRKREEANDDKKVAKTVKVKGPKFQPLEDPSAIDASKMEGDDIELVLLRVPASVSIFYVDTRRFFLKGRARAACVFAAASPSTRL